MVYSSSPDGHLVDKKGYNWHMSARPDDLTDMHVAGSLCWTLTNVGDIPAGAIVIEGTTAAGRVNISEGAAEETLLGVAIHTRSAGDQRPLTYTVLGVVEILAGETVVPGTILQACDTANCLGSAEPWINDVDSTDAAGLTAYKRKIGKALTGAVQGGRFWAYVNFMG